MTDDDTRSAEGFTDEPETTGLPTTAAPTSDLAWSDDDDDEPPQRAPWRSVWGIVAVIAACATALGIAGGAVAYVLTSNDAQPLPSKPTTTAAQPVTPPPTVTSVPAPSTSVVTQTVTPTTTSLSPEDRDARFIAQVHANLPKVFFDRPVEAAQGLCDELATGDQTKQSAMAAWLKSGITVENATVWWNLFTSTYCPQYR